MWTKRQLQETMKGSLSDYLLVVASNRQPYSHLVKSGRLTCVRQSGGLVTALDPVMQAVEGVWVAEGTSPHDRQVVDENGKVLLPPENPSYSLRRIFLSKEERDGYYYGYSNEGLWPMAHVVYARPVFRVSDWKKYQKVNERFAQTILEEVGDRKAFVWIQDYHLILVGQYLREANHPNLITSFFWHIPWPNPEVFHICPQKKEILEALICYDLLGFQIRYHCDNFLAAVDANLESRIDRERNSVVFQNHETLVRPFPISVDFEGLSEISQSEAIRNRAEQLREEFGLKGKKVFVGVDRLDYTKGIPDKFRAVDRFLAKHPEYREKIVFFQLGEISRIHISRYKELNDELNALAEEINWKYSQGSWVPIIFTRSYMPYQDILALYTLADACLVSSLHDGMNLVAKEFVSARSDADGVLILSYFTGAARELTDAILINPYDTESFAEAIFQALAMPRDEREKRMKKMREVVAQNNIFRWAGKVLSQLLKFDFQEA